MSYFKLLGYNVSKKLTGSANSLFSTAVISGSSSAPNLKDMVPPHASAVAAIEGFGGVPPIRPLETLHNALSLRQLDSFLDMMTSVPLFRTPASSPPKHPSPASSTHESLNPTLHPGISREYHSSDTEAVRYITPAPIQYKPLGEAEACDRGNLPSPTSPNSTGWSSEPQSFLSSEPSSPAPTSTGECSMSISLISNDGNEDGQIRKITQIPQAMQQVVAAAAAAAGSNGQSPKTTVGDDELPADNADEDEDHTLTLRQSEEQKKQDVKLIFEQRENVNPMKASGSCKKIGRFRVESTDITQGDVRIKETDNAAVALDRSKPSTPQNSPKSTAVDKMIRKDSKKSGGGGSSQHSSQRRRNFSRSQSVTAPKPTSTKPNEPSFSYKCTSTKQGSFSTMSVMDLEDWKLSVLNPSTSSHPTATVQQQDEPPILTVAGSVEENLNVTIGFDVQDEKKE